MLSSLGAIPTIDMQKSFNNSIDKKDQFMAFRSAHLESGKASIVERKTNF